MNVSNINYIYISYKISAGGSIDASSTTTISASIGSVNISEYIEKECIKKNDGNSDYCDSHESTEERIMELDVSKLQGEFNLSLSYSNYGTGANHDWRYNNNGSVEIIKIYTS